MSDSPPGPTAPVRCPHCAVTVLPTREQTCPACRRALGGLPPPDPPPGHAAPPPAEEVRPEAGPADDAAALAGLDQAERPLLRSRREAVRGVGLGQPVDPEFAARCDELAVLCRQSGGVAEPSGAATPEGPLSGLPLFFRIRAESWSALARAARERSADELARHEELWRRSERLRVGSGAEAVRRFRAGLSALTPRPWVTPALVAANVLVFAAMLIAGAGLSPTPEQALAWGANYGPRTLAGEWWRPLTSAFVHFGPLHLAFNMWALWGAGSLLERLVGSPGFLSAYLLAGLCGGAASLAWNPAVVSAGASGAVFGVFGALGAVLLRQGASIPAPVLTSLRGSTAGLVGYNVLFGLMLPGIDNAAHLGGLAGGFACGLLLAHPLSAEGARGRLARAGATAMAGSAVLVAIGLLLPEAPADVPAELSRFAEAESRILREYDGLVERVQDGRISDPQFADALEESILPQWREARRRLESLRGARGADPAVVSRIAEYMLLRERSWESLAEGARGGGQEPLERHRRLWQEADRMAQALSRGW